MNPTPDHIIAMTDADAHIVKRALHVALSVATGDWREIASLVPPELIGDDLETVVSLEIELMALARKYANLDGPAAPPPFLRPDAAGWMAEHVSELLAMFNGQEVERKRSPAASHRVVLAVPFTEEDA